MSHSILGKSFEAVAHDLGMPMDTVKAEYLTGCKKIASCVIQIWEDIVT